MPVRLVLLVAALGCASRLTAAEPDRAAHLTKMKLVMGPLPGPDRKVPLDVRITDTVVVSGYTRKTLSYASEAGDRVPAYLLLPDSARFPGQRPAMLCLHQTIAIGKGEPAGLGTQESKRQAVHLVKRGYVCLAPDYPSFGDYKYDFKAGNYQSGTLKAIWNNMRGIDLLQSLPEVDPARIGAVGHSLGGHNSLFTAAFDDRIKVVVSSCGWNSFHKYSGGNLKGWAQDRYMPRIASEYGLDSKRVPFDFDDVLLAICPRAVFSNSPLRDANFEVSGVKDIEMKVAPAYRAAGAADELRIIYPDAAHEFPDDAKRQAYEFLDRRLTP